jgi:tripeptidyl-peptidase I
MFPRLAYQEYTVLKYLKKLGYKNAGFFNCNRRGFSEIAAQAQNFRVMTRGLTRDTEAPLALLLQPFNAIAALLNSARVSSNLLTLGFLNPWIYTVRQFGLNDITTGAATGCNGLGRFNIGADSSPVIPGASWNATEGWDPVTKYGTSGFGKLLKISTPFI